MQQTPQDQSRKGVMRQMGEIIITILVMAVGALISIGGVVLLLYIFAD